MRQPIHLRICSSLVGLGVLGAASAWAAKPNCLLHFASVESWQALDNSNVVVLEVGTNDLYRLVLSQPVPSLRNNPKLSLKDTNHDQRICGASQDRLIVSDGIDQQAIINSVKKLSPKEISQLERQFNTIIRLGWKQVPKTPTREAAQ
jgi:hypothetical protein